MLILALDTTTDAGSCALWQNGAVLQFDCPTGRPHSETLLPLIRRLLAEASMGLRQLDGIAFGAGPGAFTGLRITCGMTQGLAVAHDLPVIPVCSLETMAIQVGAPRVFAVLDARMGEVYAANYACTGDDCRLQDDIRVISPDALVLPAESGVIACGNAIGAYPLLAERLTAAGIVVRPEILPQAAAVAQLAAPRLAAGQGVDAALAAPFYVRNKVAKTVAERLSEGGKA